MSDRRLRYSLPIYRAQATPHLNPTERPPHLGAMQIDSQSGFAYRKPILLERPDFDYTPASSQAHPTSPITPPPVAPSSRFQHKYTLDDNASLITAENLPIYDTQSNSSSSVISTINVEPRPPSHVPTSEYYKYTTPGSTSLQRKSQILIWIVEKSLQDESISSASQDLAAQRRRHIARQVKLKALQHFKHSGVDLSIFSVPDQDEEKENPINIANSEKLAELEKGIQIFRDELHDWKNFSGKVFRLHAETKDITTQEPPTVAYNDIDIDFMLDNLDETQQHFYYDYCRSMDTDEDFVFGRTKETIDPGVTQIRQALNTTTKFVEEIHHFTKERLAIAIKKVEETGTYIPLDVYQKVPDVFENNEELRRKDALKNLQRLIGRVTRQNSASSVMEDP
ncbi:hypothetical protein MUCCIDRAFT_109718 [Mucor lusitanicus CBS 277.49]|uniref:Uncharacterized protein n=2 Tax=Mucor circinelloides f. lusitanicus TaxID=29924 RepID=A0A162T9D2_MUCCL|nr:hypothetical protein MUCCIDRAFT_109718 [Mucor lusitanicus CBS 277.49]